MQFSYKYVENIISKDLVDFANNFSLRKFELNGDSVATTSYCLHSAQSDIYDHLLHYLKPRVEKETGLSLRPMYAYTRIYLGGSDLKKHTDRNECEISVSITLKYYYENNDYVWPLYMEDKPFNIKSGDGVIYKGCEVSHWRPEFLQTMDCWHHQLFLHYIDVNGPFKDKNIDDGYKFL